MANEYEHFRRMLADGLAVYKARLGRNNSEVGYRLGISHTTVARILNGEAVTTNTDTFLRIMGAAGLVVRKREEKFEKV